MESIIDKDAAVRGSRAVLRYRAENDRTADITTAFTDLLADLIHFSNVADIDFEDALDSARMHHDAERIEYLRAKLSGEVME